MVVLLLCLYDINLSECPFVRLSELYLSFLPIQSSVVLLFPLLFLKRTLGILAETEGKRCL